MGNEILLIILGMAIVTYLTRFGFIYLFRYIKAPHKLERWLKHVPTGILTAMIVPTLLLPAGHLDFSSENPYLYAGIVAGLVAWKTGNIFLTMISGMGIMLAYNFS